MAYTDRNLTCFLCVLATHCIFSTVVNSLNARIILCSSGSKKGQNMKYKNILAGVLQRHALTLTHKDRKGLQQEVPMFNTLHFQSECPYS